MEQIVDANSRIGDIDEAQYRTLARWFWIYNYENTCGMKTGYFSCTASSDGAAYATAVHTFDDLNLLKYVDCMVMLDCRHRRYFVEFLQEENLF